MFGRRIIGVILVVLLIGGLLSLGGYLGWQQGYAMGSLAAAGESGQVVPRPFYGVGFYPFFPLFFGFGLIFKLLFFLLVIFLIARMFRFWSWRTAGGPPGHRWGRHWHHGPPPWYRGEKEPFEGDEDQDWENDDEVKKA